MSIESNLSFFLSLLESEKGNLTFPLKIEEISETRAEVVAVSPSGGSSYADQARDRASEVFSKILEMGVPTERLSIASSTSSSAQAEEVHIYLKN